MTEDQAKARGLAYKVHVNDMSERLSARTRAEAVTWSEIIVDEATDRIPGAHILGHAGEELINVFALAMRHDLTATNLTEAIYGFPTFSADIRSRMSLPARDHSYGDHRGPGRQTSRDGFRRGRHPTGADRVSAKPFLPHRLAHQRPDSWRMGPPAYADQTDLTPELRLDDS
jgi:Pyridine nucleotide-disulphide oxidoreductase, dimerisation domain